MKSTRSSIDPFIISDRDLADLVLDEMDTAILICDKDAKVVLANPVAQKMHGGNPVGLDFQEAYPLTWVPPADSQDGGATGLTGRFTLEPVLAGDAMHGLCTFTHPNSPVTDILISSAPYRGPEDQVLCCIVSMMDVTSLEDLKKSQREALNLLNGVTDSTTDAIGVKDADGRFLMINAAGARMLGVQNPADLIGHLDSEFLSPAAIAVLHTDDRRVREQGRAETVEFTIPFPTGVRTIESVKAPFRDLQGKIIGTMGISRDVTALRRAQADSARQAALLDLTPDAINVHDLDGTITFWNKGAERIYGWTADQVLGKISHTLFATEFSTPRAEMHRQLTEDGHWEGELGHRRRDGSRLFVASRQVIQYDRDGKPIAILEINEDITERKQRAEAQAFLTRATEVLTASLDFQTTLQDIAELAVPLLGDWCAVHIRMDDDKIRRLAFVHHDPAEVRRVGQRPQAYALDEHAKHMVPHVLRTGVTEFYNDVPEQVLLEAARDAEHLETLKRLKFKAYLCLPLRARAGIIGTVTFVMSDSGRSYTPYDVEIAQELVRRAGLAVDNARLYRESQRARDNMELVAQVSVELMTVMGFDARARRVTQLVVPRFADWSTINLVDADGSIRLGAATHSDPAQAALLQEWAVAQPLDPTATKGTPQVIRTGQAEWVSNLQPDSDSAALPPAQATRAGYLQALGVKSYIIVPLTDRRRVFGALTFARTDGRASYTFDDLLIAEHLARRTSVALDNAALLEQEQQARQEAESNARRITALQKITSALAASVTRQQVGDVVLAQGLHALNATGGVIAQRIDDSETIQVLSAFGFRDEIIQAWGQFDLRANTPISKVMRTGEIMVLESDEQVTETFPETGFIDTDFADRLVLPLQVQDRIIGGIYLAFPTQRELSPTDLAFARALAQQAAQAMDRARLYESEFNARRAAEANAARISALQRVTSALAAAVTRQQVAHVVLAEGLTALNAGGGAIAELLQDNETIELLSAVGYPAAMSEQWKQFTLHDHTGFSDVIRTGEPIIFETLPEAARQYPNFPARSTGFAAWLIFPLEIEGRVIGAINLGFPTPREFSPTDLGFARALAQQAAQALDRARLYESELTARHAAERAARRSEWLTEASHLLSSSLDYKDTLKQLAALAVPELADWCGIDMAKPDGTAEQLVVMHKDPEKLKSMLDFAEEIKQYFTPDWNAPRGLPHVLRTGESEIYYDIPDSLLAAVSENETQLSILRQIGYSSVLIVPLNSQGRVLGAITLVNTESRRHFTDEDLAFTELLAGRAAVAIENSQLYHATAQLNLELEERVQERTVELSDAYQELRALAARLQTIREEERTDIARELHDELGQALTALKMDLAAFTNRLPKRSKQLRERAQAISAQIDTTIKTVRRLSSQLRPGMLDDLGLGPSIEWYAHDFQTRSEIECVVNVPEEDLVLPRTQATALFRIFQETLTNVARHANATLVQTTLELQGDTVVLQVQDNGRGIDVTEARGKRSLGLVGMRERAEMIQGTLEIQGEPGKGTTVTVRVPMLSETIES